MQTSPQQISEILTLHKAGTPIRKIAQMLNISKGTVQYHIMKGSALALSGVDLKPISTSSMTEVEQRIRLLNNINEDLEHRCKKYKKELDDLESEFRKIRNERDDLKIELKTFEAQKALELKALEGSSKQGLNGIVEKLGDPGVMAQLPALVQAFNMLIGKPAQAQPQVGNVESATSVLPNNLNPEKAQILKFVLEKMSGLSDKKFGELTTFILTISSSETHDQWLSDTVNAMVNPSN
jgi:TolA-binding protein